MNELKGIIEDCYKSDLISKEAIKKIIEIIGKEEWNYLYDENSNICTTMGELIITLKGIPELEKENAELSKELKEAKDVIKKLYSHVFQGMGFMEINDYNVEKAEAEQFLKECEK